MPLSENTRKLYSTQELELLEGDMDTQSRRFPHKAALGASAGLVALCFGFLSDMSVFSYVGSGLLGMTGWCTYRSFSRRASLDELQKLILDRWYERHCQ